MSMDAIPEKAAGRPPAAARARFAVGLVLVILVFAGVWWRTVSHTPLMTAPPTHLPPNNAYPLYARASGLVVGAADLERATSAGRFGSRTPLQPAPAQIDSNRSALALVHRGLRLDYMQPPVREADQTPPIYRFAVLARLLALEAGLHTKQQDWDGAVNAKLDQIAFSEGLLHGAGVEAVSVAMSYRRFRTRNTPDAFDRLTAAQLHSAIARLQRTISSRPVFADSLVEEKWLQISIRDQLLSNPNWREDLSNNTAPGSTPQARVAQLGSQARLLLIDKQRVMLDYGKYIDGCIMLARNAVGVIPAYPSPPPDSVNQALFVEIAGAHQKLADAAAEDANLLVRLALRCYRLEHGAYPPALQSLCPEVIDRVPGDPRGGAGITYSRTGGSYRLTNPVVRGAQPQARVFP